MIGFDVETNKRLIPIPHCPFCNGEMAYLGDISEPANLRECQRKHDPSVPLVFLNFSRFNCLKCGFSARFLAGELRHYIATEAQKC